MKHVTKFLAILAATGFMLSAQAQTWPEKPIRIIVPTAPGIAADTFARLYGDELSKSLKTPVVVENRPGAGGVIGCDAVAKSAPDGYTILWGYNSLFTINPHIYPKMPFDPVKDLKPVVRHLNASYILVANKDYPINSFKGLLDYLRANPGKEKYASMGAGTISHLAVEIIQNAAGVSIKHIPYKQNAVNDVIAGHVPLILQATPTILPFVISGKLKALATTGPKRLTQLPDVPTVSEILPGVVVDGWHGIWVPAATPRPIIDRLNAEFLRISTLPKVQKAVNDSAFEFISGSSEETEKAIVRESDAWARLIKEKGIKAIE